MTDVLHLHWLDYAIIFAYLAFSLGLGFALRRSQANREEFFSAGRSMGRITVGLSVMATLFSANSFVMYPSTAYANSLRIFMAVVAFWAMGPLVAWVFIPVYAKLNCNTAYEYLERRFHVSVRCLASALFIVLRIAWMAAATFAASVAISGISGVNQYAITIGLGVVAIAYTMLGGLRAVMWTDVLQFFVFFGTILFAAALLIAQSEGGASQIVETYFADRENLLFDFSLDPALRFGTIAIVLGSFLEGLSAFGADQVAVQRYIAAKDARTSQTGFLITLLGTSVVVPGLLVIGAGLFSYFKHHPNDLTPVLMHELEESTDEKAVAMRHQFAMSAKQQRSTFDEVIEQYYGANPNQLHTDIVALGLNDEALPRFVRLKFPPGVVGLLVAALMAATMSSIDSGIHSITTALVVDFRDRLFPALRPKDNAGEMLAARLLVVAIGALAITLACFVGQLGDVFAVAKKTVGAFAAPLLAVFIVGLFVPRATSVGVFFGTWIGAAFTLWFMYYFDDWFAMWFFPVGFFSSVGLSLLLSLLPFPGSKSRDKLPLTFWAVRRGDR
jgi:Na+/proline symporter